MAKHKKGVPPSDETQIKKLRQLFKAQSEEKQAELKAKAEEVKAKHRKKT